MKKVVVAIVFVLAISVALTIYTEGLENAYGGIFAGLAPDSPEEAQAARDKQAGRLAVQRSQDYGGPAQTNYKMLVDRVRTKTNAAMRKSEERSSGHLRP